MVMAAKLTRLTHKTAIQLHPVAGAVPLAVLTPSCQSGNFWLTLVCLSSLCICIHPPATQHFIYWYRRRNTNSFENGCQSAIHLMVHPHSEFWSSYSGTVKAIRDTAAVPSPCSKKQGREVISPGD